MVVKILIDKEACTGCKACIELCPRDCFKLGTDKKTAFIGTKCHSCGHCISVCPEEALSHPSFPAEDYELISEKMSAAKNKGEELYYFMKGTRSTRKFKKKAVEKEIFEKLIDVVRYAPTGHHSQNVSMAVLEGQPVIQKLKDQCAETINGIFRKVDNPFVRLLAPVIGKRKQIKQVEAARGRLERIVQSFSDGGDYLFHGAELVVVFHSAKNAITAVDNCNIAATYLRTVAQGYGLGSCIIGYLVYLGNYSDEIKDILGIPRENRIHTCLILGYPKYSYKRFVGREPVKVHWKQDS